MIHPTAIIHPNAQLHPTVQVGPYAVIGDRVTIGAGTVIDPHVVVGKFVEIGKENHIFSGAVIGGDPQDLKFDGAESWVEIGDRNRIREYVTINRATAEGAKTIVGNDNLLMAYVHVAHDCAIEDNVVISGSVSLAGHVHIESRAVLGGMVGIHQFVHIGSYAMLGGMSRVVQDVPPFMLVEGNPALIRSLNLVGLKRAGITREEVSQLKKAFRLLYRSGHTIREAIDQLDLLQDSPNIHHLRSFLQQSHSERRRGSVPSKKMHIEEPI